MAVNEGDDVTVSLVDVLEEDEELENEASAVLGGSDPEKCSYPEGYVKRQALYACNTCTPKGGEPAGICLACSYKCHEGHDLFELYTKRNFRCDCGNGKFTDFECKLYRDKDKLNINNKYNHNFFGLYCTCERPYPDPEDQVPDEMIQCIICEDWFHGRHLGSVPVESIELQEMVCVSCMNRAPFLWAYAAQLAAPSVTRLSPSKAEVEVNVEEDGQPTEQESTGNSEEDKHSIKREGEQPSTSTIPEKAVTNGEAGCKRTYSQMEASADAKSEPVTCKLQELKAKGFVKKEGAIFWPYVWRSKLCTCSDCKKVYTEAGVPFLLDESDTVLAYEKKGKTEQESSLETRDPLMTALSSMGRVQQLELIYEYNDLKTELKDYLKRFADEGKVVTREDIQRFFEEFQSRKRRRMSAGQYYCA
ncbi:putative E3 ubiquitin-protein ligase UBR7 [Lepisosteus oculatus]|uniref:Putative E3 ubiquitin-protein ligase UBR7 n=1 Tax=Lepisosteus oculatus TaxID=7918 RepID=W5N659_LEPOC|nr:PREDICTED: putative E3 ubiquitin-protein ligase UBR7 [Lepisosteus oculatus]XP_015206534.1 PREDICTED: putative E3 ubiquitin-protein ligase UBR7 [Lepisosteus oculatus]XP_015206535.1 PREDICTED: putative E3 ubiquitin-protein ligase UBR7 [Lepisosteus oculatus]